MKTNFCKKDSCPPGLRGNNGTYKKDEVKEKKIFCSNKDSSPVHHRGTYQSDNHDSNKLKKKTVRKKDGYPTGFREVYPSANYDEVQRNVKKNIKVTQNQKVTILNEKKQKNLNVDVKDSDISNNICTKTSKVSAFKSDSQIPSCASVQEDLISHNQDPIESPLMDLYFLGEYYKSLYDGNESLRIPQVLDNNAMKINFKGSDRDIEQLVYFLHEFMGQRYSIESNSKPLNEIEKCFLNTNLQKFLLSFLVNLPLQNSNEASLNEIKSAVVQQTVMNTYSASETDMDPIGASKDTLSSKDNNSDDESDDVVAVDNEDNPDKISVASSTESYEVQEIKTNDNSENDQTVQNHEDSDDEKAKEDSASLDNESNFKTTSKGSNLSKEQQGSNQSDPQIKSSKSNDVDSDAKNESDSSSEAENSEDEHSEASVNKTENSISKSQSQGSQKGDKDAEGSHGEEQENENSEDSVKEDEKQESAETNDTNGESNESEENNDNNGSTDDNDETWLQNFYEKMYCILSKLNIVKGPTIHESVMHGYNYIRAVKDSLGEDAPDQKD